MYRIYNKIHLDEGEFKILVKSSMFQKKFHGSLQRASLITCMVVTIS